MFSNYFITFALVIRKGHKFYCSFPLELAPRKRKEQIIHLGGCSRGYLSHSSRHTQESVPVATRDVMVVPGSW